MNGFIGADVSLATTEAMWKTLLGTYPFEFAVVEAYWPSGPNAHAQTSIKGAQTAGIKRIDVYHFPGSFTHTPPAAQVQSAIAGLGGLSFSVYWIDVEPYRKTWGSDTAVNIKNLAVMVSAAQKQGVKVGLYTSESAWKSITGNTTQFGDLPLWYYHWDAKADFNDFSPFGGWKKPAMKQYFGNGSLEGIGYDADWIPAL